MQLIKSYGQIFCLIFSLVYGVLGQDFKQEITFKHIASSEAMPRKLFNQLLVDSRDMLWLATTDGLYSFDGKEFLEHKAYKIARNSFCNRRITGLLEDRYGQIWCGTESLAKYDPNTNTWSSYFATIKGNDLLLDYIVPFYIDDKDKVYCYIGKFGHIAYFDPCFGTFHDYKIGSSDDFPSISVNRKFTTIDSIWCFDQKKSFVLYYKNSTNEWKDKKYDIEYNKKSVGVIYYNIIDDENVWVCSERGLFVLNSMSGEVTRVPLSTQNDVSVPTSVFIHDSFAIVSTFNDGLVVLNKHNRQILSSIKNLNGEDYEPTSNSINRVIVDKQNKNLIIAGKAFVDIANIETRKFKFIRFPTQFPLEEKYYITPTEDSGLILSDGIENYHYMDNSGNFKSLEIVIGSHNNNLLDNKKDSWKRKHIRLPSGFINISDAYIWRPKSMIKPLFSSSYGNDSYLLLDNIQLLKLSSPGAEEIKIKMPKSFNVSYPTVLGILPNQDLILSTNRGYIQARITKDSLSEKAIIKKHSGSIISIANSNYKNKVYMATGQELYFYDFQKMAIDSVVFPFSELDRPTISSIFLDSSSNLWVSTNAGIYRFDSSKFVGKYSSLDLLPSTTFSAENIAQINSQNLAFGTTDGILIIDPTTIEDKNPLKKLMIKSFKVNDTQDSRFLYAISHQSLNLKYAESSFMLDCMVSDLVSPKNYIVEYKLKGFDENWIKSTNPSNIRYSNLPFGKYILSIHALNTEGQVSSEPIELKVNIAPPWYHTYWFRFLMVLSFAAIAYSIYLLWKRRLQEKYRIELEKKQLIEEERKRIARDMHDDLGSSLSALNLISANLKQGLRSSSDLSQQKDVDKIHSISQRLNFNIREIIWTTNTSNDNMESLIYFIQRFVNETKELIYRNIEIISPENIPDIELSAAVRKKIYLICKEAIHNALKHTKGKIIISIKAIEPKHFIFTILDEGPGFNIGQLLNRAGNGIFNMKERAKSLNSSEFTIESSPNSNTIVTLSISF
ncbi:MAG TPA: triple tyrosine motif-containing protein [Saprospiraceae bacterium]|nr:triple tyrosine motif-containing protein [Saprospiraceae bacterium]